MYQYCQKHKLIAIVFGTAAPKSLIHAHKINFHKINSHEINFPLGQLSTRSTFHAPLIVIWQDGHVAWQGLQNEAPEADWIMNGFVSFTIAL